MSTYSSLLLKSLVFVVQVGDLDEFLQIFSKITDQFFVVVIQIQYKVGKKGIH